MNNKRNALGKGLSALLGSANTDFSVNDNLHNTPSISGSISGIPIGQIETNPFQPRTDFEQVALEELSASIKEQGIIQPITVRKLSTNKYQLISGERRFRASQLAGLTEIPSYIRVADDQAMLEMALVENIQRENLNPIEVAISYKRLIDECNLTQDELSQRIGKNRTTVTNFLRLLKLPADIQLAIRDGRITMSHARAIINIDDKAAQLAIFKEIISNNLSVRNVEDLARKHSKPTAQNVSSTKEELTYEQKKFAEEVSSKFETKVELKPGKNGEGKIIVNYYTAHDLERIISILNS